MIQIREEYCPQNHNCPVIGVCPEKAISQETPFSPPEIDQDLCSECGSCTQFCRVFQHQAS